MFVVVKYVPDLTANINALKLSGSHPLKITQHWSVRS